MTATVLAVSLTAQKLDVVTDRDMYGPTTVTDASQIEHVAAVVNAARPSNIPNCVRPGGTGSMTLAFGAGAGDPALATVTIRTAACPGMTVRNADGKLTTLAGGAATVRQIESILGLPWPRPTG
jgi:hypothetical protein